MERVNKKQLGDRIRELRTAAGHTQDDLAELLDQKRQVVSYYENGTRMPNIEQIMTIAKEYNTTTDYLLGLTETATELKTEDSKALRICCDYTGLSEKSIECLYFLKKNQFLEVLEFANKLISYLENNKFDISQFCFFKKILYSLDSSLLQASKEARENGDSIFTNNKEIYSTVNSWKIGNESLFQTAQFRLSSAFDKIINGDKIVRATRNIDNLYNALVPNKDVPFIDNTEWLKDNEQ